MADIQTIRVALNWKILLFTAAISLLTTGIFGVLPSLRGSRVDPGSAIKLDSRTIRGRLRGWSLSHVLVAGQVALSLMLLITASLFIRTLNNLENSNTGFDRNNVIQAQIDPAAAGYKSEQMAALSGRIIERVQMLPNVESASASVHSFGAGMMRICCVFVEGRIPQPDEEKIARAQQVTADYFRTMGIAFLAGQSFSPSDTTGRQEVPVINETMALRYFGRTNP